MSGVKPVPLNAPLPRIKKCVGKPRRGREVADVCTVRLDKTAKTVLTREFGSLGNALYYLYTGVAAFRSAKGLEQHPETPPGGGDLPKAGDDPYLFEYEDLKLILLLAQERSSRPIDRSEARGLKILLTKLHDYLSPVRVRQILRDFKNKESKIL